MNKLVACLLNDYQRDFPLCAAPFDRIAEQVGSEPDAVLAVFKELQHAGVVSRIGPVFRPNTIGVSTLAALAVPPEKLDEVAATVSGFSAVNHNYEREHAFNLWFVAAAGSAEALADTLAGIEAETGLPVLALPLVREYHIDLGFHMSLDVLPLELSTLLAPPLLASCKPSAVAAANEAAIRDGEKYSETSQQMLNDIRVDTSSDTSISAPSDASGLIPDGETLIAATEQGIPLALRPYQIIANKLGVSESAVLQGLSNMMASGVVNRYGVVVRHRRLGYTANAMVVWDLPDNAVDSIGELMSQQHAVTLCYRRPRRLPQWPYNLFCMIHGKSREQVQATLVELKRELSLIDTRHEVLFSRRCFKQRGARYRRTALREAG